MVGVPPEDLSSLLAGKISGRTSAKQITLFKQNSDQESASWLWRDWHTTKRTAPGSEWKSRVSSCQQDGRLRDLRRFLSESVSSVVRPFHPGLTPYRHPLPATIIKSDCRVLLAPRCRNDQYRIGPRSACVPSTRSHSRLGRGAYTIAMTCGPSLSKSTFVMKTISGSSLIKNMSSRAGEL